VNGNVWKVEVSVDQSVEELDDFLILESMKMEIAVTAEQDCVVKELLCAEGDSVEEGQVLLVVEEE
jgi:acetyl-CoA carboxylase biotin carboxyl carrier protein